MRQLKYTFGKEKEWFQETFNTAEVFVESWPFLIRLGDGQ